MSVTVVCISKNNFSYKKQSLIFHVYADITLIVTNVTFLPYIILLHSCVAFTIVRLPVGHLIIETFSCGMLPQGIR